MRKACDATPVELSATNTQHSEDTRCPPYSDDDEMVEDTMECSMNRVFWKASQPKDDALKQLMNDAYTTRKPSCTINISPLKTWTPSPRSAGFDTSSSSSSAVNLAERPTRLRRTTSLKRVRTTSPITPPYSNIQHPGTASLSRPPVDENFDQKIHKVIALLPLVSKQLDENAKREQERALREKQKRKKMMTQRALQAQTNSSLSTKHRREHPMDVKGKRREIIAGHEEEEMVVDTDDSQEQKCRGDIGRSSTMPPPTFVPLRKTFSDSAKTSLPSMHRRTLPGFEAHNLQGFSEEPSFSTSSYAAPHSAMEHASIETSFNASEGSNDGVVPRQYVSASLHDPKTTPNLASTQRNQCPQSNLSTFNPAPIQNVPLQSAAIPKSSGPPRALGMRRPVITSSQTGTSSTQSLATEKCLPVKQDKFKVPFARNNIPALRCQVAPDCHASVVPKGFNQENMTSKCDVAGVSSLSSRAHITRNAHSGSNSISASAANTANLPSLQSTLPLTAHSSSSSSSSLSCHAEHNATQVVDVDSSITPGDADSSMDFDIGIDPAELEKICSAYD